MKARGCVGLVLGVFISAMLTGCSALFPEAEIVAEGPSCEASWDDFEPEWAVNPIAGTIPAGFVASNALWCRTTTPEEYVNGVTAEAREVWSTNVDPIVKRSQIPDEPYRDPSDYTCPATIGPAENPPRVWLVDDDGRAILVRNPVTLCGHSSEGIEEAFPGER